MNLLHELIVGCIINIIFPSIRIHASIGSTIIPHKTNQKMLVINYTLYNSAIVLNYNRYYTFLVYSF
jgi:hypothetical protein